MKPMDNKTVDLLINQVLEAEKQAAQEIAVCKAESEKMIAAAREKARFIREKAQRRIQKIHALKDARQQICLQEFIAQEKAIREQEIDKFASNALVEKIVMLWLKKMLADVQ